MRQIKELDPKIILAVIVALALWLGYSVTRRPVGNPNNVLAKDDSVDLDKDKNLVTGTDHNSPRTVDTALAVISQYQAGTERTELARIGRNLFRNESLPAPNYTIEAKLPPAIELVSTVPDSAYIQTEPLKLLVRGIKLKPQMEVIISGVPAVTDFINDRELRATLPVELLKVARRLRVEVRDINQAAARSNQLTLTITSPPPPPFIFTGQVSETGGVNTRVILLSEKEQLSARVGDLVDNRWRLVSVSGDYLTVDDLQLNCRHQLKKGEATKVEPIKEEVVESKSNVEDSIAPSNSVQPATALTPDLFTRPQRPLTHGELLRKRAEAKQQKR
jgi:hypothetical protein